MKEMPGVNPSKKPAGLANKQQKRPASLLNFWCCCKMNFESRYGLIAAPTFLFHGVFCI
jgi:hypothetical protein